VALLCDVVGPPGRERAVYWGDIHCHCSLGIAYSKGSVERLYDVARSHLDVLGFTPHGYWHDMGDSHVPAKMLEDHAVGFSVTRRRWEEVKRLCRRHYRPGEFVTLLAYEWHSSQWGDHCLYFPGDEGDFCEARNLEDLKGFARRAGALLVPHHVAYRPLRRGYDWSTLDPDLSPVVEIYSEHGLSEMETSLWPYVAHSPGPASAAQTVQRALAAGRRFGFTASSDGHFGYPGSWGEGLTGFLADGLTREAVFEAIRRRRTVAVTGDRIAPWLAVNGVEPGGEAVGGGRRRVEYHVALCAPLMLLEVVRNNDVIHARVPAATPAPAGVFRARFRVEWGWGGLAAGGFFDWRGRLAVRGGTIRRAVPMFQSAEYDEARRNRIESADERGAAWVSYTTRRNAWKGIATNSILFEVEGAEDTALDLEFECGGTVAFTVTLGELLAGNAVRGTSPAFTSPCVLVSRAMTEGEYAAQGVFEDTRPPRPGDWYYLRVTQRNGQMAWTSPVFAD
jgi:hypothetical protein